MTTKQQQTEEVFRVSSPFARILKVHGLTVSLMLGGLYFLNSKLDNAEDRILAMERRVFDCYEKRLNEKKKILDLQHTSYQKLEFVPPFKKKKHGYTLI